MNHRVTRSSEPTPRQSRYTAHEHGDRIGACIEDESNAYSVPVGDEVTIVRRDEVVLDDGSEDSQDT